MRWCLIVVFILIIFVVLWPCWICEWFSGDDWDDAQVKFTHDGVLAITEITNKLDGSETPHTRSGFLVQLGSFRTSGSPPIFERVEFLNGTTVVKSLDASEFTWIDIIGDWPSATAPPIDISSNVQFLLYPDGRDCDDAAVGATCEELIVRDGGVVYPRCDDCTGSILVDALCLRTRAIHGYFDEVTNFVTIWQGEDGIDIRFKQEDSTTEGRLDSSYFMRFTSTPAVRAFKLTPDDCLTTEVIIPPGWNQIVFHADKLPGQGGSDRQDPPWP